MSDSRSRSASPHREEPKAKKQKTDGFKWKEKKSKVEDEADERDGGILERGYRNRSPRRDRDRDRDGEKRRERTPPRRDSDRYHDRETRRETDSYRPRDRERDQDRDQDSHAPRKTQNQNEDTKLDPISTASKFGSSHPPQPDKLKKPSRQKAPQPTEPMIIVNINDRLGTKAAIPCVASDSVKAFKAIVAAHIGRQPHEIMLKRQGERPFKDGLTLEDYGVSNGVQLDLELDTGD